MSDFHTETYAYFVNFIGKNDFPNIKKLFEHRLTDTILSVSFAELGRGTFPPFGEVASLRALIAEIFFNNFIDY